MRRLTFELTPRAEAGGVSPGRDDSTTGAAWAYTACRSESGVERGVRRRSAGAQSRPTPYLPQLLIASMLLADSWILHDWVSGIADRLVTLGYEWGSSKKFLSGYGPDGSGNSGVSTSCAVLHPSANRWLNIEARINLRCLGDGLVEIIGEVFVRIRGAIRSSDAAETDHYHLVVFSVTDSSEGAGVSPKLAWRHFTDLRRQEFELRLASDIPKVFSLDRVAVL